MFRLLLGVLLTVYHTSCHLLEDECDRLYGQGCICNMSQVLADIESILQSPGNIRINDLLSDVSVKIVQYQCRAYKPLPRGFDVTLQTVPKRVGNSEDDAGRQSLSVEEFSKTIYEFTLVENANIVYVFPGSDERLSCIAGSKDFLKDIGSIHYEWSFNKKTNLSIATERITIHKRNGDLTISDVDPNDKGSYYCIICYKDEKSEDDVEQEYKHDLEVITIPLYSILATVHYKTLNSDCKEEVLELIELYMPSLLHDVMCGLDANTGFICKVTAGNPVCRTVENLKQVHISVHVDLIKTPAQFPTLQSPSPNCNPICQNKIYAKLMSILEQNIRKVLRLPILANATFIMSDLQPNQNKLKTKFLIGCKAGYFIFNSYCTPCPPHHYSLEGSSSCLRCKLGYYQPNYGSKNCKKGIQPIKMVNISSDWNLKSFVIVLIIFMVLIITCCFIQQIMLLFLPLRIAFKCIEIIFSIFSTIVKFTWSVLKNSIRILLLTLLACCRMVFWRKRNKEPGNDSSNGANNNLETLEDETDSLLPENRNNKNVQFDKKLRYIRSRNSGVYKVKMKAKQFNTKNRLYKLAGFMKRTDKKIPATAPTNSHEADRDSSASSRFSDVSTNNMGSLNQVTLPVHSPENTLISNQSTSNTLLNQNLDGKHTVSPLPQKNFLQDVLLLTENDDDFSQQETMNEKGSLPEGLNFVKLHTKLRKKKTINDRY